MTVLPMLLLSVALADDAPSSSDGSAPAEPAPGDPAPSGSSDGRAPTVRQPSAERSSLGTLQLFGASADPEGKAQTLGVALGGAYGAFLGGGTAYAVFGEDRGSTTLGALVGVGVGGVAGYSAVNAGKPSPDRVVQVGSTTGYGAFLGYQTARFFIEPGADEETRRIEASGVLGSVAGLGVGLMGRRPPDGEVLVRADLGAGAGFLAGTAIASLAGLDMTTDRRIRAPLTTLTTTGFGAVAFGFASSSLPQPGPASVTLGLAQGGWIGLWTPVLLDAEPGVGRGWAGARLGLGAGYLASYGVAAFGEPTAQSMTLQLVGIGAGNALGAGVPLMLRGEDVAVKPTVGAMLALGVVGQVGAAAVAPRLGADDADLLLAGTMGSWGLWQSVGWGVVAGHRWGDSTRGLGTAMTLGGALGLATVGLTPVVDLSPQESALMLSAGGWASGLTALAGGASGADSEGVLAMSLGVGDVAFAGTGLALASGAEASWGTVARVNGGLAVGGALGALGTVIFAYDEAHPMRVPVATVVGSGLGLGVALALPRPAGGATAAWAPARPHLPRLPVRASLSVSPWQDEEGGQGAWVSLSGVVDGV